MSFVLKFETGPQELISLSTIDNLGFLSFLPYREEEVQGEERQTLESAPSSSVS